MQRSTAKILKKLLLAVAALAVFYLASANLFLATPIGPWAINRHPSRLRITWQRAWSFYPGDVRLRRLAIVGHTGRVDWSVAVDRGRGWIDLPALALKRFRVRGFSGTGVRSSTIRREEAPASRRDARSRWPWRIELQDVALSAVHEIGYQRLRLGGDGTVRGGFSLTLGGNFALDASTLQMTGARLRFEDQVVARDLDVHAALAVAPYTPRRHPGVAGFDFVTGALQVRGAASAPALLARAGDPSAGDLAIDLCLRQGRLAAGSRATLRAGSPLTAALTVEPGPAGPRLVLRADARGLSLGGQADGPPLAAAETLQLAAASGEMRFSRLLADARELRRGGLPAGALTALFRAGGLRLASSDPGRARRLAADLATGSIDLAALLRRTLLLDHVRALGVTVRAGPAQQPAAGAGGRRWEVRVTDAHLELREIDWAGFRLAGALAATGGFVVASDGSLEVQPAALRITRGTLRHDARSILHDLTLTAGARLGPYSPAAQPGLGGLDTLTGSVEARGTLDDLPFFALEGRNGRSGDFILDLRIDHGRLAPGTQTTVTAGRSLLAAGAVTAGPAAAARLHLGAEAHGLVLGGANGLPPVLRARSLTLQTDTSELRLRRLLAAAEELRQGEPAVPVLMGEIAARDLQLNGMGDRIVWHLDADRGSGSIDLAALPRRRLVLSGARIEGAVAQADPASGKAPAVPADRRWQVEVADGRIDGLRSLRYGADRLLGPGRVEGSLSYDRSRLLTLTRASLNLPSGRVESGRTPVARGVAVRAEIHLEPFVLGAVRGGALLRLVSGSAAVRGQVSSLGFLQRYLRRASWLQIQGEGRLDADVRLERGRLLPGSRVDVQGGRVRAAFLDSVATGEATVSGAVESSAAGPASNLRIDFSSFEIAPEGEAVSPAYIQGSGLHLGVASTDLDLATPVSDLRATIDLPDGQVRDLTVYNSYLPAGTGVSILSGSGRLRLHLALDAATQKGGGEVVLRSDATRVRFQDVELAGNLMLTARLASSALKQRRFQIAGTRLDLDRVTYREVDGGPDTESPGWWAHLQLTDGSMVWSRPLALSGTARLEMKDSGFLLSVFARKKNFLRWFHKLLSVEGVTAQGTLRCGDGVIDISPLRVIGGRFDLRSRLRFTRDSRQGDLFVRWGKLATGIELRDGKRTFKLRHPEEWFDGGREPE